MTPWRLRFADILTAVRTTRWASTVALISLLAPFSLRAAEPTRDPEALPVWESGIATLDLGTERKFPIAYAVTPLGTLLSLHAIVANLGGELKLGPMNQAHELTMGNVTYVFGPDSQSATEGTEIYPLSQRPTVAEDGIKVPLDLLETVYGEQLGYDFQWDQAGRTLTVRNMPAREITVDVDLVHLQGVTTVVLQFPTRPRYRIRHTTGQVAVELIGDRFQPVTGRGIPDDELVDKDPADPARDSSGPGTRDRSSRLHLAEIHFGWSSMSIVPRPTPDRARETRTLPRPARTEFAPSSSTQVMAAPTPAPGDRKASQKRS